MKNLFKNLMLVAVAAMAFTACTETNDEVNAVVEKTVLTFTANFDEDTRAAFGDKDESGYYPARWEGDEQVRFIAPAADYEGTYEAWAAAVKLDDDGKSATFEVVFNYSIKAGTVYAYLGDGWNMFDNYAYVNNYQTPEANTVDKNCLMASTSFEFDGESMDFSGTFSHGAAYGKMTINGFDGKNISSVEVQLNGEPQNHTYTLDVAGLSEHTYWFATEAVNVTSLTVTAIVDEVSYSKTINMEGKEKPLAFNIGEVSKFSVSGLAKDPVALDTPIVSTSFDAGEITVSWNDVENADSYSVWANYELVAEDIKTTSYVFDAEYATNYYIQVTANAAEGSVDYLDSYKAETSITTPMDFDNVEAAYTVTLTGYTINKESSYGKQFEFTSSDATKRINLPVNPNLPDELPAGVYSSVYGYWSFSPSAALEVNWYDTQYWCTANMNAQWGPGAADVAVKVTREDNGDWSITIIVKNYQYGYVKYVYSETASEPGTGGDEPGTGDDEGIAFSSCTYVENVLGMLNHYKFESADGENIVHVFMYANHTSTTYIPKGYYTNGSANNAAGSASYFNMDCTYGTSIADTKINGVVYASGIVKNSTETNTMSVTEASDGGNHVIKFNIKGVAYSFNGTIQ